ncbi:MAG: hypothetical protein KGJ88_02880 [Verrucomicrobiota bacterium]|nr:hypothetical protein [Verrucomicrobiota bacterium]
MHRSFIVILGALGIGAAVFAASYFGSKRVAVMTMCPADDLSWLRTEYHLNDAEMAHIRQLDKDYLPQCAKMCALVAKRNAEVQAMLDGKANVTAEAKNQLIQLANLRAQCQAHMLQHFIAVSQVMPPEEGRRYLAEMEKITLGTHREVEQSMPAMSTGHEDGAN